MVKCLCAQLCHSDSGKLLVCLLVTMVNFWHAQVCLSDNAKLLVCLIVTMVNCWHA